ncbi:MAG: DUF4330 domain-containing protein [Candidatus Obscuribacterales bacterium]|nr:DUF4330 domain-containing protein [Candidatus Obscuribacterales bacterium]
MKRRINLLDSALLVILLVSTAGYCLAQKGFAGVDKVITGKTKVNMQVFLSGFKTVNADIFKEGDPTFLTIRNNPVEGAMTITAVKHWPKQVSFLSPDGKKAVAFPDPTQPLAHDYVVTITEEAEGTKDGYVIKGNKIKVGNTVELESMTYRVQGVVVGLTAQQ